MFVGKTPAVEVVLSNPLLSVRLPESGSLLAILDTGYEGFAVVPPEVFVRLKLNELSQTKRNLVTPTGKLVESTGTYGRVIVPELKTFQDGFIETTEGVDEIMLGTGFLSGFKLTLNYCSMSLEIIPCRQ
ncbi:MAG: clan AA aspartic protease [Candidatus Freyarchaeota archaeon]|nr:clan AA aspartic protease [Candidatus Jordarchaeia archaeon]